MALGVQFEARGLAFYLALVWCKRMAILRTCNFCLSTAIGNARALGGSGRCIKMPKNSRWSTMWQHWGFNIVVLDKIK